MTVTGDNRILIIKLGALGDVVLATPHMRAIVEAYPEAEVTLLTSPACAVLVQGLPGLEVAVFERRGFAEMWRVLAWLRRRRFAVVFDLQGSLRSRLMTRCSGARQRIGCRPGFAYSQAPIAADETLHAFDALNRLLAVAGIDPAPPQAWLPVTDATEAKVTDWLECHGLAHKRRVLLHAGSSERWPSKRWEEAHFATLAMALAERGYAVIWIGANEDRDLNRRLARQVGMDASGAFNLVGTGGAGTPRRVRRRQRFRPHAYPVGLPAAGVCPVRANRLAAQSRPGAGAAGAAQPGSLQSLPPAGLSPRV